MVTAEFLPLCDVLFNIVSLASYFCDVVFDAVTVYALFARGQYVWFTVALCAVVCSLVACQVFSLRWYVRGGYGVGASAAAAPPPDVSPSCPPPAVLLLHALLAGGLWRYFRLFVPVDLRHVKQQVRDLCVLRMVHGFCEAAPMLLIQLYLMLLETQPSPASSSSSQQLRPHRRLSDLSMVSTALSLFSVCWALASYGKNVRQHNVHKLVLTWLGVIFQLLWRLGTITSRVLSLTVYATLFHYWVFLVVALHWLTMFLWLISPKHVFHGERIQLTKKMAFAAVIAYVYTFCYVNFEETRSRTKMAIFYSVMLLENTLLVSVSMAVLRDQIVWRHYALLMAMFGSFVLGVAFMLLYYQYFHIRKLKYAAAALEKNCVGCQQTAGGGGCERHRQRENLYANLTSELGGGNSLQSQQHLFQHLGHHQHGQCGNHVVGVFNCRFNPPHMMKRKKKKPSSFVPPVSATAASVSAVPFWRRPLPGTGGNCSDAEGGGGSTVVSAAGTAVDIQEKLREKRRQQLAELRVIQQEIAQGKLARPPYEQRADDEVDDDDDGSQHRQLGLPLSVPLRQPIPAHKRRPCWQPSRHAELLLSPQHLPTAVATPRSRRTRHGRSQAAAGGAGAIYKSVRGVPSDVDSQISMPRSYTLPREFRCYTRPGAAVTPAAGRPTGRRLGGAVLRSPHGQFAHRSNSSDDGDVDSENDADQETMLRNSILLHQQAARSRPYITRRPGGYPEHETQL